ncbi:MAG: hypothetical protein M5R36_18020 [Deltaproteobacteria bacterium]|nr:hypothetical protein [Deltaproteobacteria bacterium]
MKAGKEARRRLAEARKLVDGDAARFGAELYAALIGFVADQLGIEAPSLTANRARDGLAARGVPAEQLDALLDSLKRCDGLRYGGFSPPRAEREALLQKAGNFIDRVHRVLQKGGAK